MFFLRIFYPFLVTPLQHLHRRAVVQGLGVADLSGWNESLPAASKFHTRLLCTTTSGRRSVSGVNGCCVACSTRVFNAKVNPPIFVPLLALSLLQIVIALSVPMCLLLLCFILHLCLRFCLLFAWTFQCNNFYDK